MRWPGQAVALPNPELRIDAVAQALELLEDDLTGPQISSKAQQLLQAHERTGLDPTVAVVAMVGATGSGKSSLFNALVGSDVVEVGVLRPTTQEAVAVVPPGGGSSELLDWLHIDRRIIRPAGQGVPPGVVLVDLPDIDSVSTVHRELTTRMAERVDMLMWVMDPQKYADNVIHTQWIRPLAAHAEVMVAVLSQVDRLSPADVALVKNDLIRLLREDGVAHPVVVATSAVSGQGLVELRDDIATIAKMVAAKAARVHAILDDVCQEVADDLGLVEPLPEVSNQHLGAQLVDAACAAAGVDRVTAAVGGSYRHRAGKATGWVALRWLRAFRADPLATLHLRSPQPDGDEEQTAPATSLQPAPVTAVATLKTSVRTVVSDMAGHRPAVWRRRLHHVSGSSLEHLPERLDEAVAGTDVSMTRPSWWTLANSVQWVGWLVAVVGMVWLGAVVAAREFLLMDLPAPRFQALPVPTWMLLGGVAWTLLMAGIAHVVIAVAWRRRTRLARQRLKESIAQQVDGVLIQPLLAEDARQRQIVDLLNRASLRR